MPLKNQDSLQRFLFDQVPIRGEYVNLHASFQTIMAQHGYPPALKALLGEALCAAVLLRAIIKPKGRLSVQFRGQGALKLLLAQCDEQLRIRGLVKWEGELSSAELIQSVKQGILAILLDTEGQSQYQGMVTWQGQSLAESIEGYFRDSEQLATKVVLSVNDHAAFGLLLQVVPGENKQSSDLSEAQALPAWQHISKSQPTVADFATYDADELLKQVYPHDTIRLFPAHTVTFGCTCSRERSENALLLMGKEEAQAELRTNREIVVTCDFCNQQYIFDRAAVDNLFAEYALKMQQKSNNDDGSAYTIH